MNNKTLLSLIAMIGMMLGSMETFAFNPQPDPPGITDRSQKAYPPGPTLANLGVNLLSNGSFDMPGPNDNYTDVTVEGPGGAGYSAAENWTLYANTTGSRIITELVPSSLLSGTVLSLTSTEDTDVRADPKMIHVITNGNRNGLVQVFGNLNSGPDRITACAWIYIVSGSVMIGTGNGGNTGGDMILTKKGSWEYVEVGNGVSPANEFIIYSANGAAEFYVESAQVTAARQSCRCQPE